MTHTHYGPKALRLRPQYQSSFGELVEAMMPVWSGKAVTHYCYRADESLHVLSADSFEVTINMGCQPHIPTGGDLKDSCRVAHVTADLWDNADVQGFIELLLRKLKASLVLSSVDKCNTPAEVECAECDSTTAFVFDNGKDQFSIHLEIVLQCLKLAEEYGQVPPLPDDWWCNMNHNLDSQIF
ncbi:hypothetical protein [Vibrio sp. 10N.261.46.A3]|uniref:hypothetical protein n=1 Tax=Vibrio sp. 10N.261.46.A3 TaxID=3229658 RepID=UPI00355207AC